MKNTCDVCQAPDREVWVPQESFPELTKLHLSGPAWGSLWICDSCNSLWSRSDYEPSEGYPYLVAWRHTESEWLRATDATHGKIFSKWHQQKIFEVLDSLPSGKRVMGNLGCISKPDRFISIEELIQT